MYRLEPTIMTAVIKLQHFLFITPYYTNKFKYYCLKGLILSGLFWTLVPEVSFFITNLHQIKIWTSVMPTLCQLLTTIFKVLYLSFRVKAHFNLLQVYELTIQQRRSFYSEKYYTMTEVEITKLTKWFTISIFLYVVVYTILPLAYQIYLYFISSDSEDNYSYFIPFKHEYFFTISSMPQYIFVIIIGILGMLLMGMSYLCIDLAFFSYCLYTRALFRDLQTMFDLDVFKDNVPQIKDAVKFHTEIFGLINKLNDLFSPIIFAQFLNSSLIICTVIFQSTLDVSMGTETIKNISFVFGAVCQILFYSIFGTMVTVESFNIANAAYFCKWTDGQLLNNKIIKQFIIMIIHKSQKEVELKGLKMFNCNLETFLSIMDVSFSTLAVLQSIST